jgi:hypothetical protein
MTWFTIILYPLLTTAAYYIFYWSKIWSAVSSRYRGWFEQLMHCAACSGFWYGLGVAGIGYWRDWSFLTLPGRHWLTIPLVGFCSLVWTPLMGALHLRALMYVSALGNDVQPPLEEPPAPGA